MGVMADSLFTVLMSWVRALVNGIWALFSQENTTLLEFLGKNWIAIAVVMIAAGLVIDWLVWLVRWQPYHIWAQRVRRLLRITGEDEEEDGEGIDRAEKAVNAAKKRVRQDDWNDEEVYAAYEAAGAPVVDEDEERDVISRAQDVPDEELGAYPGMHYENAREQGQSLRGTQRYSAVTAEGPGAAEVARRREEIEAFRRMQEEAAERARAERIRQQEDERMAAQRAEEMRREEEEKLAQEAYERELAEYERQKAQYERDMAEYARQKAEYDAYVARQQRDDESIPQSEEGEEPRRRQRRRRAQTNEEPVGAEAEELKLDAQGEPAAQAEEDAGSRETVDERKNGWMNRMARLIEEEDKSEFTAVNALPPRIDRREAYRPAKTVKRTGTGGGSKGAKR